MHTKAICQLLSSGYTPSNSVWKYSI